MSKNSWLAVNRNYVHRISCFWQFQKEDVDNWVKSGKAADVNAVFREVE